MKTGQKGYTLLELVIAVGIMALVSVAAGAAIFQNARSNSIDASHMTRARSVENAGDWISHDSQMALVITTANLTPPELLTLNWTENVSSTSPVHHTVIYSVENVTGGVGVLTRTHTTDAGLNEQTMIARNIYFNPPDIMNSSNAGYDNPVLTVTLTSLVDGLFETKQYIIRHRANTAG